MNFFELVAGVVGTIFVAAIAVGFLIVEALPEDRRRYMDGQDWREPPSSRGDEQRPPRCPGR